ncbi:orf135 (mitochondrion) [Beta vulgaris subsp. vulgaris]|uniref:Orf135 protein n=3 Tax=Beta TaxID=3554 RepID=Q9MF39_BETVV|nr:orf135 [Beta vulgaris subsp. vulgaris]YP_004222345.1 hypothetical protein LKY74_mgp054 [Beta vulgaris subsp. maritima]YP_004842150.1 hypothetical protein LKY79_mgp055 [Beta macrocarpa]CBJ14075.1 hypothetical protein [Beta vulgaris subsp. maritima]CBJ17565.1 hypothetical protein [Beta vulgaris subsp. maritima]CBJ20715.1 hypothetical protein [Beta vulgaris subsp. maritima]CBL51963.1 hypothetical protein [Beta vulgaris subsp. maritima]CBX24955.1 hypothetical protein [Beta macrocarpa]
MGFIYPKRFPNPPKNSAVQLSTAITACARIHMYKYISRDDCYYTDTDSIVLSNPLPEDDVSSSELGKFKLEDQIKKEKEKLEREIAEKKIEKKEDQEILNHTEIETHLTEDRKLLEKKKEDESEVTKTDYKKPDT